MSNKFRLNEKFILVERMILAEAAAMDFKDLISKSQELCEYIRSLLSQLDSKANDADRDSTIESIFRHTDKLLRDTRGVKDVSIIRGYARDYLNTVEKLLLVIDPDFKKDTSTELRSVFNTITKLVNSADTSNAVRKEFVDELSKIHAALTAFKKDITTISTLSKTKLSKEDQHRILANIYEDMFKVSKLQEKEYKGAAEAETISDAVNSLYLLKDKPDKVDLFLEKAQDLDNKDFGTVINNKNVANFDRDELAKDKNKDTNWDTKFKNTAEKDVFWREYLNVVWGKNASSIESLGDAFKKECEVLGFDESSNPFITFIKTYFVDPADGGGITKASAGAKGYPIDRAHYEAIHNNIANNAGLTTADLTNPKDPLTEANNIIFYSDFYTKAAADAPKYLTAVGDLRSLTETCFATTGVSEETKTAIENLQVASDSKITNLIAVVLFNSIPTKTLLTGKVTTAAGSSQTLRPIAEVNQLCNVLNAKSGSQKAWTAAETPMLVAALKNTTPFKGHESEWAKKFIVYIADSQPNDGAKATNLANLNSTFGSWFSTTTLTITNKTVIINELKKYGGAISWKMLNTIIEAFKAEKWI